METIVCYFVYLDFFVDFLLIRIIKYEGFFVCKVLEKLSEKSFFNFTILSFSCVEWNRQLNRIIRIQAWNGEDSWSQ